MTLSNRVRLVTETHRCDWLKGIGKKLEQLAIISDSESMTLPSFIDCLLSHSSTREWRHMIINFDWLGQLWTKMNHQALAHSGEFRNMGLS